MSDRETTDNFITVWTTFVWPEPEPPQYRLYHNADGSPRLYTMESLPGEYIVISREAYIASSWQVRVENGELRQLPKKHHISKLHPDQSTGTRCHVGDVCLITDREPSRIWNVQQNDVN